MGQIDNNARVHIIALVPESVSMLLFGSYFIGLVGFREKVRKRQQKNHR
jgi:hypothetical protein